VIVKHGNWEGLKPPGSSEKTGLTQNGSPVFSIDLHSPAAFGDNLRVNHSGVSFAEIFIESSYSIVIIINGNLIRDS
jgi:hypothetical protein